jgi:hypothetical protein
VRARAAAEALKHTHYRRAALAEPYDNQETADTLLTAEAAKIEADVNNLSRQIAGRVARRWM